jgi:hypothetical protein
MHVYVMCMYIYMYVHILYMRAGRFLWPSGSDEWRPADSYDRSERRYIYIYIYVYIYGHMCKLICIHVVIIGIYLQPLLIHRFTSVCEYVM